jgi:uncharacterized protein (DUF169 family)
MESKIAQAIRSPYPPTALLFADEKPEGATQFAEGRWGCIMWLLASAAKGRAAVADRSTFGCLGGGTGLGFGNRYEEWPGGIECFYYFLSTGNEGWEHGRSVEEQVRPFLRKQSFEHFVHGEGYVKSPELVRDFVEQLPMVDVPGRFVVLKPVEQLEEGEVPEVVTFLADPDRLAALVVLANYDRPERDNVVIPHGAGCQSIGIYAYREARGERQKAVVGLTDPSARVYVNRQIGPNLVTFTVPWRMFLEMEGNVEGSFLEKETWQSLLAENPL